MLASLTEEIKALAYIPASALASSCEIKAELWDIVVSNYPLYGNHLLVTANDFGSHCENILCDHDSKDAEKLIMSVWRLGNLLIDLRS